MKKFYSFLSESHEPLSFKNKYIYTRYEAIYNFLISQNKENIADVLCKPVLSDNQINWYSSSETRLKNIKEYNGEEQNNIINIYNLIKKEANSLINKLKKSQNEDKKEWAELLNIIINNDHNDLFYNGSKVFMLWGWKSKNIVKKIPELKNISPKKDDVKQKVKKEESKEENTKIKPQAVKEPKKHWYNGAILFCKNNWWTIPLMLLIIFFLLLHKGCTNNKDCQNIDDKISEIDKLIEQCCNDTIKAKKTIIQPCGSETKSGKQGITENYHYLSNKAGVVKIYYDMMGIPDLLEVFIDDKRITSTHEVPGNENGYVGNNNQAGGTGVLSFYKTKKQKYCKIIIKAPLNNTEWRYTINCPE